MNAKLIQKTSDDLMTGMKHEARGVDISFRFWNFIIDTIKIIWKIMTRRTHSRSEQCALPVQCRQDVQFLTVV